MAVRSTRSRPLPRRSLFATRPARPRCPRLRGGDRIGIPVAWRIGLAADRVVRLSELGEFGFIERLRRLERRHPAVDVGIGDDCAVVRVGRRRVLLTTDALVEGVHFRWSWDRPAGLGRRAFLVNASDIAAMGGTPRFALLSLAAPRSATAADLGALVRGFAAAARENACVLVGGNLSASRRWVLSATLVGEPCGEPLRRSGARVGDGLWVSGS